MNTNPDWKQVWEQKSAAAVSDFELDRGHAPDQESESRSEAELIEFVQPRSSEVLLDAGCGTGVNITRFCSRVQRIIALDYAAGSLERCHSRIERDGIANVQVLLGSVTNLPLPGQSVDKVLCMSVLQYLDDEQFCSALREFARVSVPGALIILHVKNLSSLYWSTLWLAKKTKTLLGGQAQIEYFRSFDWYVKELQRVNCEIVDYYSSNLLTIDLMPPNITSAVRRFELRRHQKSLFRHPFLRRHGAELLLKAKVPGGPAR